MLCTDLRLLVRLGELPYVLDDENLGAHVVNKTDRRAWSRCVSENNGCKGVLPKTGANLPIVLGERLTRRPHKQDVNGVQRFAHPAVAFTEGAPWAAGGGLVLHVAEQMIAGRDRVVPKPLLCSRLRVAARAAAVFQPKALHCNRTGANACASLSDLWRALHPWVDDLPTVCHRIVHRGSPPPCACQQCRGWCRRGAEQTAQQVGGAAVVAAGAARRGCGLSSAKVLGLGTLLLITPTWLAMRLIPGAMTMMT